ncbi:hypothetical protein ACRBEV_27620 [Methylobacterium phyllosphaerae]
MRGSGEGHRHWDSIPDTLEGGARVKSAMTNGTVSGRMGAGGATTLVVSYGTDQSLTILVPPQASIAADEPADRAIMQAGRTIFLTAEHDGDTLRAVRVAVGTDGLTPPQ